MIRNIKTLILIGLLYLVYWMIRGGKMLKKLFLILLAAVLVAGCATIPQQKPIRQTLDINIKSNQPVKVETDQPKIHRSMEVQNTEGKLSQLSFQLKGKGFVKIFSGLSVADVTRLWNDLIVFEYGTEIRDIHLFLNSPGGDAFSGLALADQVERARKRGFKITIHASGIVASAAVPILAAGTKRYAAEGTIFMVHEAALWKWPGRETASDIEAQARLMALLRDKYIGKLTRYTTTSDKDWRDMEGKTTWFSATKALKFGLIDGIE